MKKQLTLLLAFLGWFAVVAQYVLLLQNRTGSAAEATARFFTYFTILTNIVVALYFTTSLLPENKKPAILRSPGTLTAVAVYITVVGLIYQLLLRQLWHPEGLQRLVDELLHTIIPAGTIYFWYRYEHMPSLRYSRIPMWMVYPLLYLAYMLLRGRYSGFYPYPFADVSALGLNNVLINAGWIALLFLLLFAGFIALGRAIRKPGSRQPA